MPSSPGGAAIITIRAPFKSFSTSPPGNPALSVTFDDYLATVPDHVGEALVKHAPNVFVVEARHSDVSGGYEGRRFLVVRNMGLGDVLMCTPLVRALKGRGASAVDFATERAFAPALENGPHVDRILHLEDMAGGVPARDYDAVIDLRLYAEVAENSGSRQNRVARFASAADVDLPEGPERHLDYAPTRAELVWAERETMALPRPLVGYVWRSTTANRNWTDDKNREAVAALASAGFGVVAVDRDPHGLAITGVLDTGGRTNLRQAGALLACCDAVVCPDTGLFHLASALDKPIVTYFGPFPLAERASHDRVLTVENRTPCFPCRNYYCLSKSEAGISRCIDVPVERLVAQVRLALSSEKKDT